MNGTGIGAPAEKAVLLCQQSEVNPWPKPPLAAFLVPVKVGDDADSSELQPNQFQLNYNRISRTFQIDRSIPSPSRTHTSDGSKKSHGGSRLSRTWLDQGGSMEMICAHLVLSAEWP